MSTPNLNITRLTEGQKLYEVTVNEALNRLDSQVHLVVEDRDLTAPPSASDGESYLIAANATGEWEGHDGDIASFYSGWIYTAPKEGWTVYVKDESLVLVRGATSWGSLVDSAGSIDSVAKLDDGTNSVTAAEAKTAYDHSQIVVGNPHDLDATDVGAAPTNHDHVLADITDAGTAAAKDTGTASGDVPVLDANGRLVSQVLPDIAIGQRFSAASQSAMVALDAQIGDICVRTDDGNLLYLLTDTPATDAANWHQLTSGQEVTSVNAKTGPSVTLSASDVNAIPDSAGSVNSSNLASLSVLTAKIADLAVATGKIADKAVTTGKLDDAAVTAVKLASFTLGELQTFLSPVVNQPNGVAGLDSNGDLAVKGITPAHGDSSGTSDADVAFAEYVPAEGEEVNDLEGGTTYKKKIGDGTTTVANLDGTLDNVAKTDVANIFTKDQAIGLGLTEIYPGIFAPTEGGTLSTGGYNSGGKITTGSLNAFGIGGPSIDGEKHEMVIPESNCIRFPESESAAGVPNSGDTTVWLKDGKFVIAYNDDGTVKYRYLDLTSTDATWTYTTTAP